MSLVHSNVNETQQGSTNATHTEGMHWNDSLGVEVRIILSISNIFVLALSQIVFVILCKTRHLPVMARFLGSSSAACYSIIMLLCLLRKFYTRWRFSLISLAIAVFVRDVSMVTNAFTCLERLICFHRPFFYRMYVMKAKVKLLIAVAWFLTFALCCIILLCRCYSELLGDESANLRLCFETSFVLINIPLFQILIILTLTSGVSIIRLIKNKVREHVLPNKVKMYKLTLFMMSSVTNFIVFAIAIIVTTNIAIENDVKQALYECLTGLNGIVDMVLYFVWFRECRLEVLKLFSCLHPGIRERLEKMRITTFSYTTSHTRQSEV